MFVCECPCCIEEWKKERMKSYVLNGYHQSPLKNIDFSWKRELFLEKGKLSTSKTKKLCILVKWFSEWNVTYSFIFHHIKFTNIKNEIYFKILFNFFFLKHFQISIGVPPSGAPACSPFYINDWYHILFVLDNGSSRYECKLTYWKYFNLDGTKWIAVYGFGPRRETKGNRPWKGKTDFGKWKLES